jgi:hypothetical protein
MGVVFGSIVHGGCQAKSVTQWFVSEIANRVLGSIGISISVGFSSYGFAVRKETHFLFEPIHH